MLSYQDLSGQPGDLLGDASHPFPYRGGKNGGGPVNTVQVGETWTLTANGQLTDPYGNLLVTDGVDINAFESDVVSSERLSPYTCSLDSTSTPDTAVLDCTASPSSGATSSFVLCDDGRIAATEAACPDSVVDHFNHLILGPARAVQPPAQPPTAGTLSFIGDEPQLLGEVVYKGLPETAELLEVVTAGQTWTLSTDGHLVSPSGKVLVTLDGHTVADTSEDNSGHPYICTTSSQSTASKAILSCVAQIAQDDGGTSFYGSFVVCTNGEIQTEDPTCDYNDLYAFSQFTLTRV